MLLLVTMNVRPGFNMIFNREGFTAIIHLHTAVEEVKIERLLGKFNKKTKKLEKFQGAKFLKQGDRGVCRFRLSNMVAMDTAEDFPKMGRFTLRDEGKTIAMGIIKKIIEWNDDTN